MRDAEPIERAGVDSFSDAGEDYGAVEAGGDESFEGDEREGDDANNFDTQDLETIEVVVMRMELEAATAAATEAAAVAVAADQGAVADVGSAVVTARRRWVIPKWCTEVLRDDFTGFVGTFEGLNARLECLRQRLFGIF
jgi:hypothetical protein